MSRTQLSAKDTANSEQSFYFDEVNSFLGYRFVNELKTMLALFYSAIPNPCYPLNENALGLVCYSPILQKRKMKLIFSHKISELINTAESGLTYVDS